MGKKRTPTCNGLDRGLPTVKTGRLTLGATAGSRCDFSMNPEGVLALWGGCIYTGLLTGGWYGKHPQGCCASR